MKFRTKYKICLWYAYFGQGIGLTNYLKYLIFMFGIASLNVKWTLILGGLWGILCFILGWAWYKYKWVLASKEVENRFNLFVKEMRSTYKTKKFKY